MNKRYMDFVPAKGGRTSSKGSNFSSREIKNSVKTKATSTTRVKGVSSNDFKTKKIKATAEYIMAKPTPKKAAIAPVEKPVEKPKVSNVRAVSGSKMKIPTNPFINTTRVPKRPLSKNVYTKEIKTPIEEPKGPVTIISKPEKGAHVSLIVTIILTIVLGAAAGTVAFLLLPK